MRPRLNCRGDRVEAFEVIGQCLCFNEATAELPWRFAGKGGELILSKCFNEATAELPWRYHDIGCRCGHAQELQ